MATRAGVRVPRPHKYHAVATTVRGIRFASKREAVRYQELLLLEKAGVIRNLEVQPVFHLNASHPSQPKFVGKYVADFFYEEGGGLSGPPHRQVIEDVKGFKTPLYRWKKKHVEAQYGVVIRET